MWILSPGFGKSANGIWSSALQENGLGLFDDVLFGSAEFLSESENNGGRCVIVKPNEDITGFELLEMRSSKGRKVHL